MSMPEYEEVVEEPKVEPKEEPKEKPKKVVEEPREKPKKVKKVSRVIKPASPERMETVTLRSHKRELLPKDESVITLSI